MKAAAHTMSTPHLSLLEGVDLYARLGFDGVEVLFTEGYPCALHPSAVEEELPRLRQSLRELGLSVAQLTPYASSFDSKEPAEREAAAAEIARCIGIAAELECGNVRIWAGKEPQPGAEEEGFDLMVSTLKELASAAADAGVRLNVENHIDSYGTSSNACTKLVEAVGAGMGITYDPANLLMLGEADAVGALRRQLPYIRHVHFKDLRVVGVRKHLPTLVGEGEVPWASLMPILADAGYDGFFSTEFEKRWHPELLPDSETGLRHELSALKALWSETLR